MHLRVCVLTTSYPRDREDIAGRFIAETVERMRAEGVIVDVVSPAGFRHFGIAYGNGIVHNLRARPWKAVLLPAFLLSFTRAARRTARAADVVHAHWLASGLVGIACMKPLVLQLWGTDVILARRVPLIARMLVRRAAVVVAASPFLAAEAEAFGAADVRVVASEVPLPDVMHEPEEPPHVLFVGRLAEEKGVAEFMQATEGLRRVIVGDGPLRNLVPEAVGFVPHIELGRYYERAAVVCLPSRREGYGVAAREAMAYGRPVVATRVGGLADAVLDSVTGLLVPPGDIAALRAAVTGLLEDRSRREELGAAAWRVMREHGRARSEVSELLRAYRDALGAGRLPAGSTSREP